MCQSPSPTHPHARLIAARTALKEAAEALAEIDPADLVEGSLGESVVDLLAIRHSIDGSAAALADRFAHTNEWAADGARDGVAWLRGKTHDGLGACRRVAVLGAHGRAFPSMGEALRHGRISPAHLVVLGEVVDAHARIADRLRAMEHDLLSLALGLEPSMFRRALEALCYRLDPDGADADAQEKFKDFYLRASTLMHGQVRVDGMLPAEVGALLLATLDSARRLIDAPPVTDGPSASTSPSDPASRSLEPVSLDVFGNPEVPLPADPLDGRVTGQRNVEALYRILVAASGTSQAGDVLPSVTGQRPQVNVTVPAALLAAEAGAMQVANAGSAWLERFGVPHQPIPAETARRLACDASLRPLTVDDRGHLVVFGSSSRVIPPAMRSLVVRRDRHCRFAGCRARIDEVHHVVFYSRGGPTRSDNLLGLCWFHHHLVHEGGWCLTGDANHDIKGTGPDGRVWANAPP